MGLNQLGLNAENGKLDITDVVNRLIAMKNGKDLEEFDRSREKDVVYCVEWGMQKGQFIADGIIDRYIQELINLK